MISLFIHYYLGVPRALSAEKLHQAESTQQAAIALGQAIRCYLFRSSLKRISAAVLNASQKYSIVKRGQ